MLIELSNFPTLIEDKFGIFVIARLQYVPTYTVGIFANKF